MSISQRGSKTPVSNNAPLSDGTSAGDQFNRLEGGTDTPADDLGSPGIEIGISAPADDLGSPGIEIGISAPPIEDAVPADVPAGDDASTGDAGDGMEVLSEAFEIEELRIAEDDHEAHEKGEGFDPTAANPSGGNIGTLLTLGTNPDGSHFFSGNRNVDATLIGSQWGTTNLTYSFPTSGSNYADYSFDSNGVNNYHIDLGTQQQLAAQNAFAQLSAATGLTFTQIADSDSVHAHIRISQTADQEAPSAYGNFPSDTRPMAGDIWFGSTNQPFYDLAARGNWGFSTMMHEIGHAMGLKHGHQDYTFADISFYFGSTPRFGSQSLTPDHDGQAWSLMTYSPAPGVGQPFAGDKISQPQTYMQYDLAAMQYMYGANFTTNAGDTVYTFSETTGEMFVDGVGQGAPSGNRILLTIWDGNGNDTINASNYANGVTIDLRPGQFSTVDQAQLVNHLAYRNTGVAMAPGNIAMSLLYNNDSRSLIENATGGAGNDIFVGNTANNILDGGSGGSDTVIFTNTTGVSVTLNDLATDVLVNHDGETDTLRSIENIQGTSGNDTLTGNSQNNTLSGGSGGTDVLTGGGGNDVLIGGGFTVTTNFIVGSPPSQPDITKPQATNNGSIGTAVNTAGAYDIDANANITDATTIPHATINGTAFGGVVEYYRIDVTGPGAQAIFDIDGGGTLDDSILELVDSAGNVLAANDTGGGDAHFPGHDDAYLTYTFATAGTYYIRVGRWVSGQTAAQPMLAGQTYQLNISLQGAAGSTTFTANNTSSLVADGGAGDDLLVGTLGNDTLTGGANNDTASFAHAFNGGSTTGVTVNLNTQGVAQNTVAAGNDTLSGIENLIGSSLNDTLTGNASVNVLEGGLGDDMLVGGAGDVASYAGATAGVTVSLALQGAGQNTGAAGTDTLIGFQNLAGSAFDDSLAGDANANTLTGGDGNDTLNPGANAGGTVDLLDGGNGTDTASFAGNASGVTATLAGAVDGTATIGGLAIATLRSIENLTGSSNNDILTGDLNANVIEGGLGDDTLDGGLGVDTLRFTGATGATVNLATLTAQATGHGNDTITGFENVRTGSGADNITGDGNDNIFFEGGGNDTYNGAGGIDTVDYSAATSTVSVNLATVTAQNTGTSGGTDTITNIENIVGAAAFANVLQGNSQGNRFTGGSAADIILGNLGVDVIFGGAGNDILLGGQNGALDDGTADTLEGGLGNDYLAGGQGNDILRGGDGDDNLLGGIGNTSNNFFTNDGGDDTYEGGDGTDIAIMTYGNRAGVGASTVGIAFDIGNLAGNSNISWNGVVVGTMSSIERVIFLGTAVNDVVRGGGSLDSLTGNSGDDVLDGWFGNDVLDGGLGNDTLIGGEDLDTVTYATATAGVNVDLRIVGAQNTGGSGIDTLSGFEYLTGSGFGDTLRGNDEFNLIIDSAVAVANPPLSQTDSLFGYGGNDSILVTRANLTTAMTANAASNINMDGGDGDDFIELRGGTLSSALVTNISGVVTSTGGNQGYMSLGATSNDRNLDVVTVDGGAGNDRIILSGVASSTINAGSGADIVSISMRGATSVNNHQITLGSGADIIQFGVGATAAASTDVMTTARTSRVTDFEIGNLGDKFEITTYLANGVLAGSGYVSANGAFASGHMRLFQSGSDLLVQFDRDGAGVTNAFVTVFAISNGYTGGFTAFNFDGFIGNLTLTGIGVLDETITGATGNDTLSGGDGNDVLIGLSGTDTLNGGQGNDTMDGGTGADAMTGGAGDDTYIVDNIGDSVTETSGQGTDEVQTALASYTLGADVENLTGLGSLGQTLTGNGGNNVIFGGEGNDTISGGAGTDTAAYSGARANYVVTSQRDGNGNIIGYTVEDAVPLNAAPPVVANEGTDTLTGIEALSFSDMTMALGGSVELYDENDVLVGSFATIQEAVNAALADYRIYVSPGTYNENVTVNKDITIEGSNAGIPGTGARVAETVVNGLFSVTADGVTLDGLTITGAPLFGQDITAVWANNDDLTLTNLILDGPGSGYGIQTTYGTTTTGLVLSNSLVTGWGAGAYFNPSTTFTASGNTFDGNGNALVGDDFGAGTFIADNVFSNSVGSHVGIGSFDSIEDVRVYFGTNTFNGPNRAVSVFTYGDGDAGGQIITGTEQANGFFASEFVAGSGTDATYNGLGGNDYFSGGSGADTLNGGTGIDTAAYSGVATINQSGGGWTVNDGSGADILNQVEIVDDSNAGVTRLVGNGGYATIQAAINASSDGDVIRVASGTYNETLTIDKDVTIEGFNHGVSGTGVRGTETIITGQITITAAGATLDGVRLTGDAAGSLGNTAVEINASNVSIVNSVFAGTGDTAMINQSGVTGLNIGYNLIQGYSIGVYVAGGTVTGSIHDNRFQGDGGPITGLGNGVNSESSHVTIQSNIFDGIYAGSLNLFPYGPDSVDLNSYIVGNTITNSGIARPVQILPTNLTHNFIGTDFAEAFDGETAAGSYGVTGAFSYDGRGGNDHAWGGAEGDNFQGGAGDDQLSGNAGNDVLAGGANNDVLNGGDNDDNLDGGDGSDTLNGDNGNDTLHGGGGNDQLNGGAGTDTAVYDGPRGDYSFTATTNAQGRVIAFTQVGDNNFGNGNEGFDALNSIEVLQFANLTLDTTKNVQLFDFNNALVGTFDTIQAAIDSAQDNYTIRVAAGTYVEDLDIDVGVRILGARSGTSVTSLTRDAANGVGETTIIGHAHVTAADNVTLNGLRFLNDATTTGGGAANPLVQFSTGGGHLVTNSIFWSTVVGGANGVDDRAISISPIGAGTIDISGNLISGTEHGQFSTASWGRGIWFDGGGVNLNVTGNIIEWTRSGMNLDMSGTSLAIVDNNVFQNLGTAVAVGISDDNVVINNNDFTNVGDDFNFRNLTDDVVFNAEDAVDLLTPVGNGNDYVVVLGGAGSDDITGTSGADYIDGNNHPTLGASTDADDLDGAGGNDILFGRGGNDTLTGGLGDDMIDGGAGLDTAIVGTGATYVGNGTNWTVTSSDGTDTLVNVEFIQSGGSHVLLVGSGGFATIQAAVDASVDGDTIVVSAGSYFEQVVVNGRNNLTIVAATGAQVTIEAPADVHETTRSISDREIHAVFTVIGSTNVTLSNIDIDGNGAGNTVDEGGGAGQANFYGVFYRNSSGSLLGVDVTGVRDQLISGQISGVQRGVGVGVDNNTLMSFVMTGGSITDFQKNASVFNGADLMVTGVTVTGAGAISTNAQNGFQALNSTGTIAGNTITDIGYSGGGGAYSGAILLFGNTGLNITGNTIVGANDGDTAARVVGIFVFQSSAPNNAPNSGGEISGNDISYVDEGIDVSGDVTPDGILIQNNDVTNIDGSDNDPLGIYFEPDATFTTEHDVDGTGADDFIAGGAGNDHFTALGGNDILTGNGGDDDLEGDGGTDTAVYAGPMGDYTITTITDSNGHVIGFASVEDDVPAGGDEGFDTLDSIEVLQFNGTTLNLGDPVQLFDDGGALVGTFTTIQSAIDAAGEDYSIIVSAGTYSEHVTVDVNGLTITGLPGAVIQGTFLTDNGVTGPLHTWLESAAAYNGSAGDGVTVTAHHVTINGFTITGFTQGIVLGNGANVLTLDDVDLLSNFTGIHKPGTATVFNLTILDGSISDGHLGMDIVKASSGGGDLDGLTMDGTDFSDLNRKGIYTETLAHAHIDNVTMTNVGEFGGITATGSLGAGGNGINLNLKYGTYDDILIENFTMTNVGSSDRNGAAASHQNGGAIVITGRDDAPSYSGNPATVTNVIIRDGTIDGTSTGIELGEPGKANATPNILVEDVTILNAVHNALHGDIGNQSAATFTITGTSGADSYIASSNSDGAFVVNAGDGNDTITTGSAADTIEGGGADDTLDGRGGIDTAIVGTGATYVANGTNWTVTSSTGIDTLTNIEIVDEGATNVLLVGSGGFTTIQAAIDAASNGDTIMLAAGTYNETITVNKDVTIVGPNGGTPGTGVRGAEAIIDGGVHMAAAGATLDGLTVLGGGTLAGNSAGIYIDVDDVTLTNLVITGDGSNNPGLSTPFGGGVTGLVISNSLIQDWGQGTYFNPSTQFTATGNTFDDNGNAIIGDDWAAGTFIDNNIFTDSVGSHIGYGSFDDTEDMRDYVGTGNTFGGPNRNVSVFTYGDGTPGGVAGQVITGTEGRNGFFASENPGSGTNSTFNGLGGNDDFFAGSGDDTLNGGLGTDTAFYDDDRDDYTVVTTTDAHGRVLSFVSVTDDAATGVDEGTDALNSVELLSFGNVTLNLTDPVQLFDANGQFIATFSTIQAAIDAASDDYTINVAAGTYDEDLTIDVGVTIIGAQSGIDGTGVGRDAAGGTGETTIIGNTRVTATDNVTLDGLRFVNDGTIGHGPSNAALSFTSASGHVVTNSIFWSTIAGGATGVDDRAIFISPNASGSVEISDNLISGTSQGLFGTASWGRGIWSDGGGADLTVSGNTIQWTRSGINLDMSGSSTATIDGNAFENLGSALSVGVDADGLTVTDNDFFNVGTEFNFRNLTTDVTFDADAAIDTLTLVGDANDFAVILGGSGNDTFTGTDGADYIDGNNSPTAPNAADTDTIDGGDGDDQLFGRGGDDEITGGSGDDAIDGGAGTDTAIVGTGAVYTANGANWTVTSSDGTDTLVGVEIVESGAGNTLLVGSGGFTTIQAAIDAASDGDTILVAAGTYDEDLIIHVGVTILGARAGTDGDDGGRDAAGGTGETTIIGHAHVTATDNVTLDGLRFLNDATTTGGGASNPTLMFQTGGATGHSVTNSIFWSTLAGGANGVDDRAISTQVIADGSLSITDNLISGTSQGLFGTASWGRGIWFDGGGIDLTVSGNTIQWTRTGINLDMSGSSTATVDDNDFENLGTALSVGVDADGLTVTDNDFFNVGTEFNFRNLTTDVTFDAGTAIDTLTPVGDANDFVVILGGSGNDTFTGTDGADYIDGNNSPSAPNAADSDTIDGGDGDDQLFGRGGNDLLEGGSGDDLIDGGAGIDIALIPNSTGFSYNGTAWVTTSADGTDTLVDVEIAVEASGQRTLLVSPTTFTTIQAAATSTAALDGDYIRLSPGTHSGAFTYSHSGLVIFAQNTTLDVSLSSAGNFGITINAGDNDDIITTAGGADVLNGGGGDDLLIGGADADVLIGGAGKDNLNGGDGGDTLFGGADNDILIGGAGAANTMLGGSGNDAYFVSVVGDSIVELVGEGTDQVRTALASYTLANNVEQLIYTGTSGFNGVGNDGDNLIIGGDDNDLLNGALGADTLGGGAGNDVFVGGDGDANTMIGGTGNDAYFVSVIGDSIVEFAGEGTDQVRTAIDSYTLNANIEQLIYIGSGNFGGTGNDGENLIIGGAGNDVLDGGLGADFLSGAEGNDVLIGGDGTPNTLVGGIGNDVYFVSAAGDSIVEAAGEGTDQVRTALASYILANNVEQLIFTGTGAFNATGNGGDNLIVSGAGNDVLDGGLGADTLSADAGNDRLIGGSGSANVLIGGTGDDTYVVSVAGDSLVEFSGEGTDTVEAVLNVYQLNAANVENLTFVGAGDFSGRGNSLGNVITGGAGNDLLAGGLGADTLIGNAGADSYLFDTALGGGNVDTIMGFASGSDRVLLDDTVFTGLSSGALSSNAFVLGTSALDADDRILYDTATGNLYYDADGNGAGAAVLFATLQGHPTLVASDFAVI